MVYAHPFLRLVAIGSLYDTDTFSFSMALRRTIAAEPAPVVVPSGIITAFSVFWNHASVLISQHAVLETLKLNEIGPDGKYVNDDTVLYDYDPPVPGNSGANTVPQVSLAISLGTDAARGRAHAGRFYLPLPATEPDATGMMPANRVALYMAAAKELIEDINDSITGFRVAVTSNLGAGVERDVTNIRVGRVFDTIRSRRNAFDEAYQSADISLT